METRKPGLTVNERGLIRISRSDVGFPTMLLWHPENKLELSITDLGSRLLVKGMKKYLVRNQAEEGRETFVRDLPALMRYLEDHFPEAHAYLGFFRDIPEWLVPAHEDLRHMTDELAKARQQQALVATSHLENKAVASELAHTKAFPVAKQHLSQERDSLSAESEDLRLQVDSLSSTIALHHELVAAYKKQGRATLLAFGYATPLYDCTPDSLEATIDAVIADAMNTHHKSIRQKLEGGQLQIYIDELRFPSLMYTAEAVGIYSPGQLDRLSHTLHGKALEELRRDVASMLMVAPAEDIQVPGFKRPAKRIAAQAFREFLKRVDAVSPPKTAGSSPDTGIWIGNIVAADGPSDVPYLLPLDRILNVYCSGSSGSGKSYLARVIAEGAITEGINVVVIDPGNQWASLMLPEDRPSVLARYNAFGLDPSKARGFPAEYHSITDSSDRLPVSVDRRANTNSIFSLKNLSKSDGCDYAARLLHALFRSHSVHESDRLRTLVIVDEAHRLTKSRSDDKMMQQAVASAEDAIDLIGREGRKYGLNVFIVSQTIRDFTHTVATLRQNTSTKIFMRNSGLEIDYAEDYISQAKRLPRLKVGEAIIQNADLGEAVVAIRPPFSKVEELSETQLRECLGSSAVGTTSLSANEEALLRLARENLRVNGGYIQSGDAMEAIGVTSGRRQQRILHSLERLRLIRTEKSSAPGNPRLIIPLDP